LFKEKWEMDTMLLHAQLLTFIHPVTSNKIVIEASIQDEFVRVMKLMGWMN